MLIHIHFGFELNGKLYGWHKKQLYSLPKFKLLKLQLNNTSKCYYLERKKYSLKYLAIITKQMSYEFISGAPLEKEIKIKNAPGWVYY